MNKSVDVIFFINADKLPNPLCNDVIAAISELEKEGIPKSIANAILWQEISGHTKREFRCLVGVRPKSDRRGRKKPKLVQSAFSAPQIERIPVWAKYVTTLGIEFLALFRLQDSLAGWNTPEDKSKPSRRQLDTPGDFSVHVVLQLIPYWGLVPFDNRLDWLLMALGEYFVASYIKSGVRPRDLNGGRNSRWEARLYQFRSDLGLYIIGEVVKRSMKQSNLKFRKGESLNYLVGRIAGTKLDERSIGMARSRIKSGDVTPTFINLEDDSSLMLALLFFEIDARKLREELLDACTVSEHSKSIVVDSL